MKTYKSGHTSLKISLFVLVQCAEYSNFVNMKIICALFLLLALSQALDGKKARNCFARDSSGVRRVTLSNGDTFDVLCNSDIAGAGWLVIQQRVNGRVDFNKSWEAYRNGFGDFWDGDFFLGLKKIHRLTVEQPQELYIHMERFNGTSYYARYDEFAISNDTHEYKLSTLGTFSGTTMDELRDHKNKKFAIARFRRAPEDRFGGWWFTDFDRR